MNDTAIRVLILVDVPSDADLIEKELKMQKMNIVSSRVDGKDAFTEALVRFKPDVVLCDCASLTFTGIDALNQSLLRDPLLPFIIVTGSANEGMAIRCMRSGSTDYVLKEDIIRLPFAVIGALERKKAQHAKE